MFIKIPPLKTKLVYLLLATVLIIFLLSLLLSFSIFNNAYAQSSDTDQQLKTTQAFQLSKASKISKRSYSRTQVKNIIRDIFPDEIEDRAIEIAYIESRYKVNAYNGTCCYGVFQIYWKVHKGWLPSIGIKSKEDLYNPELNIKAALEIYRRAGNSWQPWGM